MILTEYGDGHDERKVQIRVDDGFYWVEVLKQRSVVYKNRHLYETCAEDEAEDLYIKYSKHKD